MNTIRQRYEPALRLDEIAYDVVEKAKKLRVALLPWLINRNDLSISTAEFEARGGEDYRRAFGNPVTTRYWRELFKRTIQRDNGAEEWNRLEIYLPDRLKQKNPIVKKVSDDLAADFAALESYIAACGDPHAPSEMERRGVWTLALEKFTELVNGGEREKCAARRVRNFLFARAPFAAPSRDALWVAFKRKIAALQKSDGDLKALRDGRENNGEEFKLPENDRDLLIHRAVFNYWGDVAPAWRDLLREGFSPAVVERYAGRAANKSHVPASVMDSVAAEVEIMTVLHRGPRAFQLIKGHITRSYDGIASLRCISGDDFTLNTYFYIPDGKGWFQLTRGQVIFFHGFSVTANRGLGFGAAQKL